MWRKIDHESLKAIIAQGVKQRLTSQTKRSLEESVDHSTEETSESDDFESSTTTSHGTVDRALLFLNLQ